MSNWVLFHVTTFVCKTNITMQTNYYTVYVIFFREYLYMKTYESLKYSSMTSVDRNVAPENKKKIRSVTNHNKRLSDFIWISEQSERNPLTLG